MRKALKELREEAFAESNATAYAVWGASTAVAVADAAAKKAKEKHRKAKEKYRAALKKEQP